MLYSSIRGEIWNKASVLSKPSIVPSKIDFASSKVKPVSSRYEPIKRTLQL